MSRSSDPRFDFLIRANRYVGTALYFGKRALLEANRTQLKALLEAIENKRREPFIGLLPLGPASAYDDDRPHRGLWLLGDRVISFRMDDEGAYDDYRLRDELDRYFVSKKPAMVDALDVRGLTDVNLGPLLESPWRFVLRCAPEADENSASLVFGYQLPAKVAKQTAKAHEGCEVVSAYPNDRSVIVGEILATAPRGKNVDVDFDALDLDARDRSLRRLLESGPGHEYAEKERFNDIDYEPQLWVIPSPQR